VNALVITGGAYPELEAIRHLVDEAGIVVAADSGLETAFSYGIRPSIVVGDFDSLSDPSLLHEFDDAAVRRFSAAKDLTDTELALRIAREEGAEAVHTSVVRAFDTELVERGTIGETISFFPLGCVPCRMSSTGLKWPLDSLTWNRGDFGLSNEFSDHEARVRVHAGRLLVIRSAGSL